jgi:hypothetical protein
VEQRKIEYQMKYSINQLFLLSIRQCAADLIRDISDVAFDELVKYKIYENSNNQIEQNTQISTKQQDGYAHLVNYIHLEFFVVYRFILV